MLCLYSQTEDQSEEIEHPLGNISIRHSKNPDKAGTNEDALAYVAVSDKLLVLAIADGMGGYRGASDASKSFVTALCSELKKLSANSSNEEVQTRCLAAFDEANKSILEAGLGSGTTAIVAIISENTFRPIYVGDSPLYLVGQKAKLKFKTTSHSVVGYAEASGLIDSKEAHAHEESHVLLNNLGAPDLSIELGPQLEIAANDTILLCSDGLSDNFEQEDLIDIIRKGELTESAEDLQAKAMQSMASDPLKQDDCSFILFRQNR